MIDLSLGKLFLVALIALIVLGPEKLPGAARTAGAILRRMRGGWDSVRAEVEHELQMEEIKRATREAAEQSRVARAGLNAVLATAQQPLKSAVTLLGASAAGIDSTATNRDFAALAPTAHLPAADGVHVVKQADGDLL
ncbi:MAG: Sec-independent protein translocase protein TatB [Rhodanobacter sp.]